MANNPTTRPVITLRTVVACRIAELVNGLEIGKFDPNSVTSTQLRHYYEAADYAISLPSLAGAYGLRD